MQRFAFRIILLLTVGLSISVALAILSGMCVDASSLRVVANGYTYTAEPGYGWRIQVQRALGKRHVVSDLSSNRYGDIFRTHVSAERVVPVWVDTSFRDTFVQGQRHWRIDVACGWPVPMLRGEAQLDGWGRIARTNDLILTGATANVGAMPIHGHQLRGVPTRPLPLGIIINSLFFAGAIGLLYVVVLTWRFMWRSAHNRCVDCTYDLRGGPHTRCPECGLSVI